MKEALEARRSKRELFLHRLCVFQVRGTGLVVVRDGKVVGLHCSGPELHAGQAAIIQDGGALAGCHLYFSRRPCATCLKMIINGEKQAKKKPNVSILGD